MVAIKGLEMPVCCGICQFYYLHENNRHCSFNDPVSFRCTADLELKRMDGMKLYKERHEHCPLVDTEQ